PLRGQGVSPRYRVDSELPSHVGDRRNAYGRSVSRTDPMGSFVPPRTTVPVMETRAAAREAGSGVRCWIGMPRNKNKRQICLIMIVSYIDNRTRSMVRFSHPLLGCVPSHRL